MAAILKREQCFFFHDYSYSVSVEKDKDICIYMYVYDIYYVCLRLQIRGNHWNVKPFLLMMRLPDCGRGTSGENGSGGGRGRNRDDDSSSRISGSLQWEQAHHFSLQRHLPLFARTVVVLVAAVMVAEVKVVMVMVLVEVLSWWSSLYYYQSSEGSFSLMIPGILLPI